MRTVDEIVEIHEMQIENEKVLKETTKEIANELRINWAFTFLVEQLGDHLDVQDLLNRLQVDETNTDTHSVTFLFTRSKELRLIEFKAEVKFGSDHAPDWIIFYFYNAHINRRYEIPKAMVDFLYRSRQEWEAHKARFEQKAQNANKEAEKLAKYDAHQSKLVKQYQADLLRWKEQLLKVRKANQVSIKEMQDHLETSATYWRLTYAYSADDCLDTNTVNVLFPTADEEYWHVVERDSVNKKRYYNLVSLSDQQTATPENDPHNIFKYRHFSNDLSIVYVPYQLELIKELIKQHPLAEEPVTPEAPGDLNSNDAYRLIHEIEMKFDL